MYMEKKNAQSKTMQIFSVPDSLKIFQEKVKSEFEGLSNMTNVHASYLVHFSCYLDQLR